jgi:hypothetical protein
LWEALANDPLIVPYIWEPQGEAVGWESKESGGYYTISEEIFGIDAHLYFYPRLDTTTFITDDRTQFQLYHLSHNYPNPFNPNTKIKYAIPQYSNVQIIIYDVSGNEIETLIDEEKSAGIYELTWNAANLPSGVYFYQLRAANFVQTKKMILLK